MKLATYVIVAIVKAPEASTVSNDALASGIMGAFGCPDGYPKGFECISLDVIEREPEE